MNVKLLRKIQKQIEKEPRQFVMEAWFEEQDDREYLSNYLPKKIPNCGTAACIGGWAIAINARKNAREAHNFARINYFITMEKAAKILGLEPYQANRLFLQESWPLQFKIPYDKYTRKKQWKRRALVAVRRIDHFIETKGQ